MVAEKLTATIEVAPWYIDAVNEIALTIIKETENNTLPKSTAQRICECVARDMLKYAVNVKMPTMEK